MQSVPGEVWVDISKDENFQPGAELAQLLPPVTDAKGGMLGAEFIQAIANIATGSVSRPYE